MDDIKESVRNAAIAGRAMSKASIKICDVQNGQAREQAISLVLPCLLKVGLPSQVKEVRALSLTTIVKVSKNAGKLLKPHITLLVIALLEALSTLEPHYLNYLPLQVAGSQQTQEKLDSARVATTKTSPMMDVINKCVPFVEESVLEELVPRLTDLIKSGIGLGTKAGCASFIVSLTHQCPQDLTPHAGKLLGALLSGLGDRNDTVKKACASAMGNLVKCAKDSSVEKLILRLKEWYVEKEGESVKVACGSALQAMAHRAPDVLKRHGAIALPLAFFAMHQTAPGVTGEEDKEESEKKSKVWEEVWLETTPGTEAGIRLYLEELVALTSSCLESQSWTTKAQAAATMSTMASKLGSNLGPPHLGLLLTALLNGLSGRTWNGKESLLKAISTVCVSCKNSLKEEKEGQPSMETVITALVKEAGKASLPYRLHSLVCLSEVLEEHEIDKYEEVSSMLLPLIAKRSEKPEDVSRDVWLDFEEQAFLSLGQTWPNNNKTQEKHQASLFETLQSNLAQSVWKVKLAILKSLYKYLDRLYILSDKKLIDENKELLEKQIKLLVPSLCDSLGNVKYYSIRTEAVNICEFLTNRLKEKDTFHMLQTSERETLVTSLQIIASMDTQPELMDKASQLVKILA